MNIELRGRRLIACCALNSILRFACCCMFHTNFHMWNKLSLMYRTTICPLKYQTTSHAHTQKKPHQRLDLKSVPIVSRTRGVCPFYIENHIVNRCSRMRIFVINVEWGEWPTVEHYHLFLFYWWCSWIRWAELFNSKSVAIGSGYAYDTMRMFECAREFSAA